MKIPLALIALAALSFPCFTQTIVTIQPSDPISSGPSILNANFQALLAALAAKQAGPLTGDVTTSGTAATLATVNSSPGACGDATHICIPTIDPKGRVVSQTTAAIQAITAPSSGNGVGLFNGATNTLSYGTPDTDFAAAVPTRLTRTVGATLLVGDSTSPCTLIQFPGTIQRAVIYGDASGSATVDVRTVAAASYTGPGSATSITASDLPALSSGTYHADTALTGWSTSVAADTIACFVLSGVSGSLTKATVALKIKTN